MKNQLIGLASDHAATDTRAKIHEYLNAQGYSVQDFGHNEKEGISVDYPDYAAQLASAISDGTIEKGIALCGTGIGMAITANKFIGVRAASVWDNTSCLLSREHNDLNCLCLGVRGLDQSQVLSLVSLWLDTPFTQGRHLQRLAKLRAIELKNFAKNSRS